MTTPVILRPEAECDARTIHADLERIQSGLGDRFVRHLKDLLNRIEVMPKIYAILWEDVRAARVKRFRYIVYMCCSRIARKFWPSSTVRATNRLGNHDVEW